jgi:osmotically-inducible protein OsmY
MKQLTMKSLVITMTLTSTLFLQACGPAVITTATTAATVLHDRRTAGTIIEDKAIELKAADLLRQYPELKSESRIKVAAFNTNLLIMGQVPDQKTSDEIEQLFKDIRHVSKVYNELEISDTKPIVAYTSDSWITTKVKAAAFGRDQVDPLRVKVYTESGTVYLMGLVTRKEADLASDSTRGIEGVQRVVRVFEYTD